MHYKNSYMSLIICLHSRHGSPLRVMPQISQAGGPHGGPLVAREGLTREGDRQTPSWIGWLFGVGLSCIYSIRERWTFLKFCNRRSCLFLEQPKYLGFRAGFEMSSKKQAIFIPLSVCWFILFPSLVFFLLEIFFKKKTTNQQKSSSLSYIFRAGPTYFSPSDHSHLLVYLFVPMNQKI